MSMALSRDKIKTNQGGVNFEGYINCNQMKFGGSHELFNAVILSNITRLELAIREGRCSYLTNKSTSMPICRQ